MVMAALSQKPRPFLSFSCVVAYQNNQLQSAPCLRQTKTAHNVGHQCCECEVVQCCPTYQNVFMLCKEVSESFDAFKVHKECTDGLNVMHVANDFFPGNDHRKHVFSNDFNRLINYVLT